AALLRRAAGRIALNQVELAQRRITLLAVGELARQAHAVEHALAPGHFARFAGGFARARSIDDLRSDDARVGRPLVQEFAQSLRDDLLHDRPYLGRYELLLRLRRELGLRYLDRKNAGEPFAHVVAGRFDLRFLRELDFLDVFVQDARHRRAQAREVGAAVLLRNIVGKAQHRLLVGVVPLHRDFDREAVLLAIPEEHVRVQDVLGAVHVFDEAFHAAREREVL